MAKVKETKVALRGEKAKKAPKASETKRKAPKQSEEIVVESDSDESSSDSSSGHSSGSESDAEKRKNTKKPKVARAKETEPASPAVQDDSSDDSDSDDSEEKKAPAAVETNGTAHKTTKASSEESSSDSESDGDDESEEEKVVETPKIAGQPAASETTATVVIPPQPFVPPPGYKQLDTKTAKASTISSLLDPKSLASKQIWHITAPSSVPISDIKSVSLAAIQSHQTILSHKGTDYNFTEEPTSNARVLLPSAKSDGYAPVDVPVSKVLSLQQTINLPNISARRTNPNTGSNAAARVNTPSIKTARPQPKVLKMRCKLPGFGHDEPGTIGTSDEESGSDVDMAEAPSKTFKQPAGETKESRSKRKRDEKEAASEASPRMDKKRRKAVEQAKKAEEDLVAGTKDEVPETTEEKERKKKEKKDKKKKEKSG